MPKCQECNEAEVTCECLDCGKVLCESCFNEYHSNGMCEYGFKPPIE